MELKYRPALRQCCERSAAATVAALVAGRYRYKPDRARSTALTVSRRHRIQCLSLFKDRGKTRQ